MNAPERGELWWVDLNPTRGHEQAGRRPGLVLSVDAFNAGPAGLVVVLPITSRDRGIATHVAIEPPEAGVTMRSLVKCEEPRSVSRERLGARLGTVSPETLAKVEQRVRWLLGL